MKNTRSNKKRIFGTSKRPRLSVYKGIRNIHAQLIDDEKGITIVSASTLESKLESKLKYGGNIEAAKAVGEDIAKKAIAKGVKKVVFDRGGRLYHGRVKAVADSARSAGLEF